MLLDIQTLKDKYDVVWADELYTQVIQEAERLCRQLAKSINDKRIQREKYETKKETVKPQKD